MQPRWDHVLLKTMREFHKARNIHARSRATVRVMDPRATVLVVDPDNSARWIEIRAEVDLLEDGAEEGLDRLTRGFWGRSTRRCSARGRSCT